MASSPDPPKPVDPNTIIQAQETANRVNHITPFGSQTYGPDGSLTTTLPQGTQNAFNNVSQMAGNQQQFQQAPQGAQGLQNAILSKIAGRYQSPSGGGKGGQSSMPMPMSGNATPNAGMWNQALGSIWGTGGGMPSVGAPQPSQAPPMQMPQFTLPQQSGMAVPPQGGP